MTFHTGEAAVTSALEGFILSGAALFGITAAQWPAFGYLLHECLGLKWSELGYAEGPDFKLAASVGVSASITMSIHSAAMMQPNVITAVHEFLADFPQMMVIIYGDIEADELPDDDIQFTLVITREATVSDGDGDYQNKFGLSAPLP